MRKKLSLGSRISAFGRRRQARIEFSFWTEKSSEVCVLRERVSYFWRGSNSCEREIRKDAKPTSSQGPACKTPSMLGEGLHVTRGNNRKTHSWLVRNQP